MSTLRLKSLTFRAGANPGDPSLVVTPGAVTVIVGPNNAGKSVALREIEDWCKGVEVENRLLNAVDVDLPNTYEAALGYIEPFKTAPRLGESGPPYVIAAIPDFSDSQSPTTRIPIYTPYLEQEYANDSDTTLERRRNISRLYTVRLDGRSRFVLIEPKDSGDAHEGQRAENYFQALAENDRARKRIAKITTSAIKLYFSLDPLKGGKFSIDMNSSCPPPDTELNFNARGRAYHNGGNPIATLGDGVKCFVGLVAAVRSLPHKVILVDEPEAFLHPPLARTLGSELTFAAKDNEASLVIATHSPDFLVGCVEAAPDTVMIRLTYESGEATARRLEPTTVRTMFTDPLLRSTDVLSALFHKAAVVTEADTDRVFYDEMNRRLQEDNERGTAEARFLNANGKGTVYRIVGPLRRIGIPAAAIVDLDLLEQSSYTTWEQFLDACQVPAAVRTSLESQRARVASAFAALDDADKNSAPFVIKGNAYADLHRDQKQRAEALLSELASIGRISNSNVRAIKTTGIAALAADDKAIAVALITELQKYGLFLVPVGEVERWLGHLGVNGHGAAWLTRLLEQIGNTSTDTNYVRAGRDDVWEFLENIARWVIDPKREGTKIASEPNLETGMA